jgi:hypothetical protein
VTFTVTVNPVAVGSISGNLLVCAGDSTTLTASGGASYEWNTGATTAAITVSPGVPTTYVATISTAAGCSTTASVFVNVGPGPVAAISGDTALCSGETTTLTASGGGVYLWSSGESSAEITVSAALAGTYTGYEIRTISGALTFIVYLDQRGVDRTISSGNALVFSPGNRNLVNIDLDEDWSEEATFVYAGGQGEGASRVIEDASNTTAIGESVIGRAERFRDARNSEDTTQVQDEADDALYAARSVQRFSGSAQDTVGCIYGIHYRWGDRVTAQILDQQFDCRVDPVHVTIDRSRGEALDIRLEATNE